MGEKEDISPNDYVIVTIMNELYEVQYMEKSNNRSNIHKLNSDEYIVLATGEKKEFKKNNYRVDNKNSIRQTMKKLRYLINANFSGNPNELWATLTFRDTTLARNPKSIYLEFNKFIKRLKYKYGNDIEYIVIIEPHSFESNELQAWHGFHLHLLLKNNKKSLYIPYNDFEEIWGHGMCRIEHLKDIDNIGAYLTAYLTNVEINDTEKNGHSKKYIKGARLWLYPKGIKIYRKSRGIIFPKRVLMKYKDAQKMIGVLPHYKKSYQIETENFSNKIIFEQYNKRRK